MQTQPNTEEPKNLEFDEELADTLTAISVVSKRLAQKIKALSANQQKKMEGDNPDEQKQ